MAKLVLKFGDKTLKEVTLVRGVVTIGRAPSSLIRIDNPAVSGSHAKVYWEADRFVVEDLKSSNGTYLNGRAVNKAQLTDGDTIQIGKHIVEFCEQVGSATGARGTVDRHAFFQKQIDSAAKHKVEPTEMMDTEGARELIAAGESGTRLPEKVGVLQVLSGRTDKPSYLLTSKISMIGKSEMASIRLKGWSAPQVAAVIQRRGSSYFIAGSGKESLVKVNGSQIVGEKELQEGDLIELASLKMTFGYQA